MKNNLIIYLTSIILILSFSKCTEEAFDEIGTNPNYPTEVPINLLMAEITVSTAFEIAGTDLAWYSSVFVEQTAGVHGQLQTADQRTGINSSIGSNNWNALYATTLNDIRIIIERGSEGGSEEGNWTSVGIAKVLQAYCFSVATDIWGEIPFSEALKGKDIREPHFDDQKVVYEGILVILDDAIADLQKTSIGDPGANDLFFSGDATSWIKTAYGLKMRLLNRLSNVYPASNNDAILALAANAIDTSMYNWSFDKFTTDATGEHPWYQELNDRSHHAISKTIDDILAGLNDPRRNLWFSLVGGSIVPAPSGIAETDQSGSIYSKSLIVSATAPLPMLTYDEIKFIEAEAYFRKDDKANAYQAYLDGIEEAMTRQNVDAASIATYLAQANVAVTAANLTLSDIITQKYIAFWMFQPIEAYNDYRRTGIPTLQNPIGSAPNRFPYTTDEAASNSNVPDKTYKDKVWWAK